MQAVILVGGQATRLRPLATNTPKAMVPVLNRPFLEYVIRNLSRHDVREIVLAQHHLAGPIEEHLGDGSRFGVSIAYVVEDSPRGTAGAFKNVEKHITDTFIGMNGDIFNDLDITAMLRFHREKNATATIALTPVEDPTAYGLIETDTTGLVKRFLEKPSPSEVTTNMINAGTYVLEPEVLGQIPSDVQVSIERETFPLLVSSGKPVYAFSSSGYWMDMGTPDKYLQLHRDLLAGRSTWYVPGTDAEVLIGEGCSIDPSAEIIGPVMIDDNCTIDPYVRIVGPVVIGTGCVIGEGSDIEDSVIWHNVRLGSRVKLESSVVADNCTLNDNSVIEGGVLGDHVTVSAGASLGPGSMIELGETVG
ncbi:MAG TPA: NDP-sugar synthase [Dehalococcoidia bacterium]|nr:NDP-sugar synthase [Dehalococcoidia bacterium]